MKTTGSQPYHFMAQMFSPVIVWDTSRLTVAEKMTDTEREIIAKRSSGTLRDNLPETVRSFESYDALRLRLADLTLQAIIDKVELMDEKDATKVPKNLFNAEKAIQNINDVSENYRSQAGYRAACLSCLITDDGVRTKTSNSFQQLTLLAKRQQTIFQALLLKDLLRLINKYVQSYPTFDFEKLSGIYLDKLKRRNRSLQKTIESMDTTLGGVSTADYMRNVRARNPVSVDESLDNPASGPIGEFDELLDCFKKLNEMLSASIATHIESGLPESDFWRLRLLEDI